MDHHVWFTFVMREKALLKTKLVVLKFREYDFTLMMFGSLGFWEYMLFDFSHVTKLHASLNWYVTKLPDFRNSLKIFKCLQISGVQSSRKLLEARSPSHAAQVCPSLRTVSDCCPDHPWNNAFSIWFRICICIYINICICICICTCQDSGAHSPSHSPAVYHDAASFLLRPHRPGNFETLGATWKKVSQVTQW